MVAGSTDEHGHFSLRGVAPTFLIAAFASGHAPCAPVELDEDPLELVLDAAGATVTGRVVDRAGSPIENALVRFGVGMAAFAVVGPLQVLVASRGMRQLEASKAAAAAGGQ